MKKKIYRYYLFVICILLFGIVGITMDNRTQEKMLKDTNVEFVSFFNSVGKNSNLSFKSCPQGSRQGTNNLVLNAKYALLMDGSNRRVLYSKKGEETTAMASTTKIMTLLVALENGNLEQTVTVSAYAARMPKVHLGMQKGEQYRLKDLLYSLMLESHNDSAVAIAEAVGGSVEGFAQLMNGKAKALGANHTHFVTPNGLDDKNHYTTAYDLALITCAALENKQFVDIIQTKTYSFHEQTKGKSFTVNNKNRYLDMDSDAIGVKTGFTGNAGYCFVGACKQKDRTLISVVLASSWPPNKNDKYKDTKVLMEYGKTKYSNRQLLPDKKCFSPISVNRSIENAPVIPIVKEKVVMLLRQDEKVKYRLHLPDQLEAPVAADQPIGKLEIWVDDIFYRDIPVIASEERHRIVYSYVLKKMLYKWLPR